jgi:hypothetical protein
MPNTNNLLNFSCLLGFNQLSAVSKNFEVPDDQFEDLRRLANKIGISESIEIIEILGKVSNRISEVPAPRGDM